MTGPIESGQLKLANQKFSKSDRLSGHLCAGYGSVTREANDLSRQGKYSY